MVMSQYDQMELLTYAIEEGNFTVVEHSLAVPNGKEVTTGTFASQVYAENFLQIGSGENTLQLAESGTATHFNPYSPEVDGALPDTTTAEASVDRRIVGAAILKPGEWMFPLKPTNLEIAVGDNIVITTDGRYVDKKASTEDDVAIALEAKAASSGGYIRVLVSGKIDVQ